MKMEAVRTIARNRDIDIKSQSKVSLIQAIQRSEGNTDCFATPAVSSCGQDTCLWRDDCATTNTK